MKNDNQDQEAGNKKHRRFGREWRPDRLQRKIEQFHQIQQLQHQRMQFGQRGFLRPQILQLFEQQPMNGVDIMNKLQEESHGWYRPSPGSIYPLLEQLEKEGLVAKNKDGKFALTAAYSEVAGVASDLASVLSSMESNASYLEDLRRADPARLAKSGDRIDKLAKRLESLQDGDQTRRGQS